ncbi:MAG: Transglutaminase protein, partial [Microgenomates group bacterium Gr01-1014_93]
NAFQQTSFLGINTGKLSILEPDLIGGTRPTGPIPAFGHAEFEINTRTKSLIENYDDVLEITVAGQKFRKAIQVRPFIVFQYFPWVLVGIVGGVAVIYFGVLGAFIYRKRFIKR